MYLEDRSNWSSNNEKGLQIVHRFPPALKVGSSFTEGAASWRNTDRKEEELWSIKYLRSEFSHSDNLGTQGTVKVGSEGKGGIKDTRYWFAEKYLVHNSYLEEENLVFSAICCFFSFSQFSIAQYPKLSWFSRKVYIGLRIWLIILLLQEDGLLGPFWDTLLSDDLPT